MSGCVDCGKALCSRNASGRCRSCTGKKFGSLRRKHSDKQCCVCGKTITRYGSTNLCREHFITERLQSPEVEEKRVAGLRNEAKRNIEKKRDVLRLNHRKALREKPEYREALARRAREIQPLGVAASLKPDALKRRGKAISEANARRRKVREPKRPLTFEEQLEAVASGRARVVEKWSPPSQGYDYTLAGVQEW